MAVRIGTYLPFMLSGNSLDLCTLLPPCCILNPIHAGQPVGRKKG